MSIFVKKRGPDPRLANSHNGQSAASAAIASSEAERLHAASRRTKRSFKEVNSKSQAGRLDTPCVVFSLEGLSFDYSFDNNDIIEAFKKYGHLKTAQALDAELCPDVALIEFCTMKDAEFACRHLDKKLVCWEDERAVCRAEMFSMSTDRALRRRLRRQAAINHNKGSQDELMMHVSREQQQNQPTLSSKGVSPVTPGGKWCCRFVVGAESMHVDFPIVGRIIGPQGEHMKQIHRETGAKLRLRGRRSNFREGPDNQEADEPMHLCVSSNDELSYRRSCEMVEQLIAGVYADYAEWCRGKGLQVPHINLICVEGATTEDLEPRLVEWFRSHGMEMPDAYRSQRRRVMAMEIFEQQGPRGRAGSVGSMSGGSPFNAAGPHVFVKDE